MRSSRVAECHPEKLVKKLSGAVRRGKQKKIDLTPFPFPCGKGNQTQKEIDSESGAGVPPVDA